MVQTAHPRFLLHFGSLISRQVEASHIWASKSGPFQFYDISDFVFKLLCLFLGFFYHMVVLSCPVEASHSLTLVSPSLTNYLFSEEHLMSATEHQEENISELEESLRTQVQYPHVTQVETGLVRRGQIPEGIQLVRGKDTWNSVFQTPPHQFSAFSPMTHHSI